MLVAWDAPSQHPRAWTSIKHDLFGLETLSNRFKLCILKKIAYSNLHKGTMKYVLSSFAGFVVEQVNKSILPTTSTGGYKYSVAHKENIIFYSTPLLTDI